MVEFALVLPIILLLLFGMTQLALVLSARQTVAYAAEAAANGYAQTLLRATADGDAYAAAAQLSPRLSRAGSVTYTLIHGATESPIAADGVGVLGDLVAAHVDYRFPSPVRAGLGGFHFPDTIPVTAEAVARIEKPGTSGGGTGSSAAPPPAAPVRAAAPGPAASPSPSAAPAPALPATCWDVEAWPQSGYYELGVVVIDGQVVRRGPGPYVAPIRAARGTTHSAYAEFSPKALVARFSDAFPTVRTPVHSLKLPLSGVAWFVFDDGSTGYPFRWVLVLYLAGPCQPLGV